MTPTELRAARLRLGLTRQGLVQALGVSWRNVEAWEQGHPRAAIPAWLPKFLACLTINQNQSLD